jgi:hypothetical protein
MIRAGEIAFGAKRSVVFFFAAAGKIFPENSLPDETEIGRPLSLYEEKFVPGIIPYCEGFRAGRKGPYLLCIRLMHSNYEPKGKKCTLAFMVNSKSLHGEQ